MFISCLTGILQEPNEAMYVKCHNNLIALDWNLYTNTFQVFSCNMLMCSDSLWNMLQVSNISKLAIFCSLLFKNKIYYVPG